MSKSSSAVTESEIASNVMTNMTETDRIEINEEIERLKNDGYLLSNFKDKERIYDFKYSIIKLWWRRNKAF